MKKKEYALITVLAIGVLSGSICFAQSKMGPPGGQPQGSNTANNPGGGTGGFTVSDEAITACSSSSEEDTCSFETTNADDEDVTISGTCKKNPKDADELACLPKPKDNAAMKGPMISTESITACDDSEKEDSCSFTPSNSDTAISGVCTTDPKDDSKLFCATTAKKAADSATKATAMKTVRETEISRIKSRVGKIITFLDSKDVDTSDITANLETFSDKADAVTSAFDTYISALSDGDADTISSARASVTSTSKAMINYFNDTLRESISSALSEIE